MSKLERFLKVAQVGGQLKKLRWQEEDREREREEREEALKYMTPFEYQLFQKGKLPEGMGKEKEEKGTGLFPSLETIYGEKPARKGLFDRGAETGGVLRGKTARIQETLKRRELHPVEQLEAPPKTAREWTQRQMLSSGLPFEEMGATQRFVGGALQPYDWETGVLPGEKWPELAEVSGGLRARAASAEAKEWEVKRQDAVKFLRQLDVSDEDMPTELPTIMRLGNAGYIASRWKPSETPLPWRRYMISEKYQDIDDMWQPRVTVGEKLDWFRERLLGAPGAPAGGAPLTEEEKRRQIEQNQRDIDELKALEGK